MNHDYNYKHNLFTTFIVWKWFIIIATITSMFSLIYFETIFRIHIIFKDPYNPLWKQKDKQFFVQTFFMYISTAIISTIQSY